MKTHAAAGSYAPRAELAMTAALELRHLSKTFGSARVLDNVEFAVQPGEIHSLVGHNGSGKSTLVKCLSGFYRPDEGSIIAVNGVPTEYGDSRASGKLGLRFIHQDLGLVPDLSVADNIAMSAGYRTQLGRIRWRSTNQGAQRLLDQLGYDFEAGRLVRDLSLAQQTGVAIARAVAPRHDGEASLLVLDEPTANLDGVEVDHLFAVVRRLQSRGVAALFISHHLDEVLHLSQNVTVLRDGKLTHSSPASEINSPDHLIRLMLGPMDLVDIPSVIPIRDPDGLLEPILRVESLSTATLKGLDLTLSAGEIVGIAGISGSGREDIAPAISGAMSHGGTVHLGDRILRWNRLPSNFARGIALLPAKRRQDALFPGMAVTQNLTAARIPALAKIVTDLRRERRETAEWIDTLQIRPHNGALSIERLSGGNQQKVVIARLLRKKPKVLLLDEPTQGVDVMSAAVIHAQIREAASAGAAIVVASSDTDELARLCTRVLVLVGGVVAAELRGPELTRHHIDTLTLKVDA